MESERHSRFEQVFSRPAELLVRAPGRINLIGEHVDYQGGVVMPAAINRYLWAWGAAIDEPEVRLWSSARDSEPLRISLDRDRALEGGDAWANYAFGVVAKYRDAGHPVRGFEVAFTSDLPSGAGLSSSAALESATGLIVEGVAGFQLPPRERALLCQAAEHEYAGVPCGIMDQLAVNCGVAGQVLEIDCRSLEVATTPFPQDCAVVLVDTRVKHALADGEYAARRADCEAACEFLGIPNLREATLASIEPLREEVSERVYRRAHHVVTEMARVQAFKMALSCGDVPGIRAAMSGSHRSLRDDFEVSCPELDVLAGIAGELGAIGSRMMGGGFGGSTVNLFPSADAVRIGEEIVRLCRQRHGWEFEAFVVHPSDGARREDGCGVSRGPDPVA